MKEHMTTFPTSSIRRGLWLAAFVVAALLLGWFVFLKARDFFIAYDVTDLPGLAIKAQSTPLSNELGTPILVTQTPPGPSGPEPQPWDGASRVTVLVMGLDYGDWSTERSGPSHTDTMILFTIDPLSRTAGILNIPRDLWVSIPGFENAKINSAYFLGEVYQLPDGGAGLAIETVEQFLGVPINYYAQVDFYAFEKLIDRIGGLDIDVPEQIKVDPIGPGNTVILEPGINHLDGPVALAYARARNTEGDDFARALRQQQVILALRKKVLQPGSFATLISQAESIYSEIAAGVHTNMTLQEAIQFAWLAQEVPEESIHRGAIAPPYQVFPATSPDGLDILQPIPDRIRQLRDEIFASSQAIAPLAAQGDLAGLLKAENARILILNGSQASGLAQRTQEYLLAQGAQSVEIGNANDSYNYSRLVDYTGMPYTRRYLADLMRVSSQNIVYEATPSAEVDLVIILGQDWATQNPLP
jgi:LCP family protein required for cell wall assembly